MRRQYTFDTGEKTYHLAIRHSHPNVISGGSPGRIRRIAKFLHDAEIIESDRGLVTVHGTYKGIPITAFSTGMGPASVSITLPEIIEACDDESMIIVRLGTAGGLRKDMKIGDFVVTSQIEKAESTSDKIMGEGYIPVPDQELVEALNKSTEHHKKPYQKVFIGMTRITDDIYFDGLNCEGSDRKAIAVSMEFSVYCALRDRYNADQKRKIIVGELLMISDIAVPHEGLTDIQEFVDRQHEMEDTHIISGLEAIYALAQKNHSNN